MKVQINKLELLEGEEVLELGDKVMAALAQQKGKLKKSLFLRGIYNDHIIAKDRESGKLFRFEIKRDGNGIELTNMAEVRPAGFVPVKRKAEGDHECVCSKCGHTVKAAAGEECRAMTCPKCVAKMTKKVAKSDDEVASLVVVEGTQISVPLDAEQVIAVLKGIDPEEPEEIDLVEKIDSLWKDVVPSR